jgi:hypothetical protein
VADIFEDIEGAEVLAGLALIVVIGYFLYQFSQSACSAINSLFGLSNTCGPDANNAATAPAGYGGSYTNAANQTVSNPVTTVQTIVGLNQNADMGAATTPSMIGSYINSSMGAVP